MSGHSKWHKIKHQKAASDKKKGQLFGRFAKEIIMLARTEKDPNKNAALREAITRAKKANMPQANIDRLLSGSGKPMVGTLYEAFGPGGAGLLIMAETDNVNRTVNELRAILKEHGGRLGDPGSVTWKFAPQAIIEATSDNPAQLQTPAVDDIELALIDNGMNDQAIHESTIRVIGAPESQHALEETLRRFNLTITDSKVAYIPHEQQLMTEDIQEKLSRLIEALENHGDVIEVFSDSTSE